MKSNRKIKDSMFTRLLSEKQYALLAYQSLYPDISDVKEEDIEIITLENVLSIDYYNDFSMRVKDKAVIFIEAQSTWSINILLKLLIYYVTDIKNYISVNEFNIHSRHRIPVPKPDFYVVYTGKETVPSTIYLSDLFFDGENTCCEIYAKVITQGNEKSNDFFFQYIEFTHIMDLAQQEYKDSGMKAIRKAISECINRNIFKDYLTKHRGAVIKMLDFLFDQEEVTRLTKIEIEREKKKAIEIATAKATAEATAKATAEGIAKEKKETALKMKRLGLDIQIIIECTGLSKEQIEHL